MAGIYVHIPFCKQACHYCDFHFSTSQKSDREMIETMLLELKQEKHFFGAEVTISTIYFGGGSPSLIAVEHLEKLVSEIKQNFSISENAELTLEANPDDMTVENLNNWFQIGFNRLSIGIQSFSDKDLLWMNRAHSANEALTALEKAQRAGFNNISVDLIYGIPAQSFDQWKKNIELILCANVQHISAYCLTIEPHTVFGSRKKKKLLSEKNEMAVEKEFFLLKRLTEDAGFVHYEISNFGKAGFFSQHNTAYWQGTPYLGIGPSAHSYIDQKRLWNVSNNATYINQGKTGKIIHETEVLEKKTRYNEKILTGLRTKWGIDLKELKKEFNVDIPQQFKQVLEAYKPYIETDKSVLKLNEKGLMLADRIAMELFLG